MTILIWLMNQSMCPFAQVHLVSKPLFHSGFIGCVPATLKKRILIMVALEINDSDRAGFSLKAPKTCRNCSQAHLKILKNMLRSSFTYVKSRHA
jgi:hypothetical protein